ncbi:MAG: OmpW family outer membrane protein [Pseudomonadota bacterium]
MKRGLCWVLLAMGSAAALPALAAEGNWMVRARAVYIDPANKSEAGSGALNPTLLPADSIHVSAKTIPEVDISYFFTKNLAAELILTYPQKHKVSITSGPLQESIGSFKHLPPTLLLQYHFLPDGRFRPYIGAGINYTRISSVKLRSNVAGVDLDLERDSVGGALQAGLDMKLGDNLYLNFDIKKVLIDADVKLNGAKVSKVKVDPLLVGIGLGWRF